MPLTKRQFELGVDDEGEELMRGIYGLLADKRDLAYSLAELEEAVLGAPVPVTKLEIFRASLVALTAISAVEQRWVGQTDYYAFLQEFDPSTWKPKPGKTEIHRFG